MASAPFFDPLGEDDFQLMQAINGDQRGVHHGHIIVTESDPRYANVERLNREQLLCKTPLRFDGGREAIYHLSHMGQTKLQREKEMRRERT